jgi:hypothetical protein
MRRAIAFALGALRACFIVAVYVGFGMLWAALWIRWME